MVRLKAGTYVWDAGTNHISIPYGAIKSIHCQSIKISDVVISIPYGAIKRLALMDVIGYLTSFQFLMVRLKVCSIIHNHPIIKNFNSLWCD